MTRQPGAVPLGRESNAQLFSAAASGALGGPLWLRRRRGEASERLAGLLLPSTSEEDWRYSRIDELELSEFAPLALSDLRGAAGSVRLAATSALAAAVVPFAAHVRSVDGVVVEASQPPEGVSIRHGAQLAQAPLLLGRLVAPHAGAFLTLSDAFCLDVLEIEVAAGVRLDDPIVVTHEQLLNETGDGRCPATFPRTVIRLGQGAAATVVEVAASPAGRRLVVPVTEAELADGARLELYHLQELAREAWSIGYQASRLGRAAELVSFAAGLGGDYARQLTRCELAGEGGASRLFSVYLGDGEQMQDMRTFQEHIAARTKSQLVFKGAVAGTARSVYTGLIAMRKGARRAEASQTNRNLVLSEGAHADSVPNLDIEENDVRCSHASAVGPVDPDLVFYLESRGVEPSAARRLILLGFFEELLAGLGVPAVARHVRESVASRLESVVGAGAGAGVEAQS